MTAVELQEQTQEARGDLEDRIDGVRLEVEKVRTHLVDRMGEVETKMSDKIGAVETRLVGRMGKLEVGMGELETRMVGRMGELEVRMGDKMVELETRLLDQISGVQKNLRGWMVIGISIFGTLVSLLAVFG